MDAKEKTGKLPVNNKIKMIFAVLIITVIIIASTLVALRLTHSPSSSYFLIASGRIINTTDDGVTIEFKDVHVNYAEPEEAEKYLALSKIGFALQNDSLTPIFNSTLDSLSNGVAGVMFFDVDQSGTLSDYDLIFLPVTLADESFSGYVYPISKPDHRMGVYLRDNP